MKKNFLIGIVVGGLLFGSIGVFAGQYAATENSFPIQLNGENISLEGYNIDGSTYFKLRDISEIIGGFDIGFNNNTIQLSKGDMFIQIHSSCKAQIMILEILSAHRSIQMKKLKIYIIQA